MASKKVTNYTKHVPPIVHIEYRDNIYVLLTPVDGSVLATSENVRALSEFAFSAGAHTVGHYYDPTVIPGWYIK